MHSVESIAAEIVRREGGFVNDPDDPGGATKHGVTLGTLRRQPGPALPAGEGGRGDGQVFLDVRPVALAHGRRIACRGEAAVFQEMLRRRDGAAAVEATLADRHGDEEDAARPQHAQPVLQRTERIGGVFQHMVGDDEVLTGGGDAVERETVGEKVRRDDGRAGVGAQRPQRLGRMAVDVARLRAGRQRQRAVQGADLQAARAGRQVAQGEVAARLVQSEQAAAQQRFRQAAADQRGAQRGPGPLCE